MGSKYGILMVLLLFATVLCKSENPFCPKYCKCTLEGASGITAYCTELNAEEKFIDPIQHIVVSNGKGKAISLTDNIFTKVGLEKIESIKIVNTTLSDISVDAFKGLSSLYDLNLEDNRLFLIHADSFANNTNLRRLKLNGNPLQLTQLLQTPYDYLLKSSSLTEFDLSDCQLSQILPKTFSQLKNLITVNLASNFLKSIPKDVFVDLEYLEELDLSNNLINKVEKDVFKQNKDLSVLKLRKNSIEYLRGIDLPSILTLDLSDCKLKLIMRETLEGMGNIKSLNLSSNSIEIFSEDAFSDLTSLKHLDLSRNSLTGPLPQGLFKNNRELETLSLAGNADLKIFVENDGFLEDHLALSRLDISACYLSNLTHLQLRGLDGLYVLNVSQNFLKTLDKNVFNNLKKISYLDLSYNLISSIDDELFSSNKELMELRLGGNPIIQLSTTPFVNKIPALKLLDLSNCQIEKIWMDNDDGHHQTHQKVLSNLLSLDISNNNLKSLNVGDFSSFKKLEKINLVGNPLECIKSTMDVIDYFTKRHVDPYYRKNWYLNEDENPNWNEFIKSICPIKTQFKSIPKPIEKFDLLPELRPITTKNDQSSSSSSSVQSIEELIIIPRDNTHLWTILFIITSFVAIGFVVYLFTEFLNKRRSLTHFVRSTSLGGQVRTTGTAGQPIYYKLYEECSVPTKSSNKGTSFLSFTPVHSLIKKGSYKIMKNNNEVNL